MIKMGRRKKGVKKKGRKHPEGVTKRNILLIALEYPEGITEEEVREKMEEKLDWEDPDIKGIKGHLADLGLGRKISGREKGKTWKEGKRYLILNPSKSTPSKIAEKILSEQGLSENDVEPQENNIWKPNPDFEVFKEMADELLEDTNIAFSFVQSEYTQRMIKEHVFPLIKQKFKTDLSKSEELKFIVLKYPPVLDWLLSYLKNLNDGMGESAVGKAFETLSPAIEPLPNDKQKHLLNYSLEAVNRFLHSEKLITYILCITAYGRLHRYPELQKSLKEERKKLWEIQTKLLKEINNSENFDLKKIFEEAAPG